VGRAALLLVVFLGTQLSAGAQPLLGAESRIDGAGTPPQGDPPKTYPPEAAGIDTVRVRSMRLAKANRWRRETPFVSRIPVSEARPGDDAASLLDRAVGVEVRRYGSLGSFSTASIRGAGAGQVQVFWDDVPLLTGADAAVNLSLIPLTAIGEVEIFRSGTPWDLAGPAGPGVIRLVPRGLDGHPPGATGAESIGSATEASLRVGSFGTFGTRVLHHAVRSSWEATLAYGSLESRGDFEYLDRRGTLENPEDDREATRRNNDFRQSDLLVRFTKTLAELFPRSDVTLSLSTQRLNREAGVPGPENVQTQHVRDRYDRWIHTLRLESPRLLDETLTLRLRGSLQRTRDRFSNPQGEVGLGRASWDNRTEQDRWGASASWAWFAAGQVLSVSWDEIEERFTPEDILHDRDGFTRRRSGTTVTAEDRIRPFGDRLLLDLAYRWHRTTDNYTGPPVFGRPPEPYPAHKTRLKRPSFGLRIDLGSNWFLKGNRTWTSRLPTFFELFGSNGIQDGNPDLVPEEGWQTDVGIQGETYWFGGLHFVVELAAFRNRTEKKIALIQNSQRTTKSVNLDESEVEGIEAHLGVGRIPMPLGTELAWHLTATLQDARDRGPSPVYNGKELPYVPPAKADLQVDLRRGSWGISYGMTYEDATYRDRFNTEEHRTPARTLHDLVLSHSFWRKRVTLKLEVANLTDARVVDVEGYPLPGRSWFSSVEIRWR
jgi:iron complex outermembrane receptor protein